MGQWQEKGGVLGALLFRGSLTGGQECPPSVVQWQEKGDVLRGAALSRFIDWRTGVSTLRGPMVGERWCAGGASLSRLIDWRTGVSTLRWRVGGRLIYDLLLLALRFARYARFAVPAYLV